MHAYCLHWLMSTGLLIQSAFSWSCKSTTGEMVLKKCSTLDVRTDMASSLSALLSRPSSGILFFVGTCRHYSYSKLYYLHSLAFCLSFCHHPPSLPSCLPLIYTGLLLMNSIRKLSKIGKNSHSQVSCRKVNG